MTTQPATTATVGGVTLAIITGASSGIGLALARHAVSAGAVVATVSRREAPGGRHLSADLSDAGTWPGVAAWMADLVGAHPGHDIAFFHCAATVEPVGFAGEVDPVAYAAEVLLDSAAPQVLGAGLLAAVAGRSERALLVMVSSGAAVHVYPGWSAYGAGKAAVDQWVRTVGAEQEARGGRVRVVAVAPGVVETAMQEAIRATDPRRFPHRERFVRLHTEGALRRPGDVAAELWALSGRADLPNGAVDDLHRLAGPAGV